ncbi:transporter substrate-binding domain-containing protein [Lacimicrobium sp. SS2-24]|uniref:substrate-binding periplasmic protein n=1 Tax=Lacimicrobium sp. SS2-24 TaxID=2005569 RepID=UPI000B4B31E8|nr:transporter substrate-binding domain-containing protein [Lacimicrobium sp. SS2-24]
MIAIPCYFSVSLLRPARSRVFWLIVLLVGSCGASARCTEPLTLVFTGDWFPYLYRINDSSYAGSDKALLVETLAELDCQLEILPLPEKRVERALLSGQADIVIAASKSPKRLQNFWFSLAYRTQRNVLVYREDLSLPPEPGSLRSWLQEGRIIALNDGGWYGSNVEQLKRASLTGSLLHVESFGSRLDMLSLGRVDGFIDDAEAINAYIAKHQLKDLRMVNEAIHTTPQHFMFSRQNLAPEFINAFNQALSETLKTTTTPD